MSDDEREKRRILGLQQWENMSLDDKQKWSENGMYYSNKYWDNLTPEEYEIKRFFLYD